MLYFRVPLSIATADGVTPGAHACLNAICSYVNLEGTGWASNDEIMTRAGIKTPETLNRWRSWLENAGYVRYKPGGGRQKGGYQILQLPLREIAADIPDEIHYQTQPAWGDTRPRLYIRVSFQLVTHPDITPIRHAVYNAVASIAGFTDRKGYATNATIMQRAGIKDRDSFYTARAWLAANGFLSFQPGTGRTASRYRMDLTLSEIRNRHPEGVSDDPYEHSGTLKTSTPNIPAPSKPAPRTFPHPPDASGNLPPTETMTQPHTQPSSQQTRPTGTALKPFTKPHTQEPSTTERTQQQPLRQDDSNLQQQLQRVTRVVTEAGYDIAVIPPSVLGLILNTEAEDVATADKLAIRYARSATSGTQITSPLRYAQSILANLTENETSRRKFLLRVLKAAEDPSTVGDRPPPGWWSKANQEEIAALDWVFQNRHLPTAERTAEILRRLGDQPQPPT